jgi:uncharacterized protein (DUF302 family)
LTLLVTRSARDFHDTIDALLAALDSRELTLFARIDHAGGAREVGLALPDEEVLLFGNPKAGTSLMQSDPRVGIELPLRMLVWLDGEDVMIGYSDPRELAGGYELAPQLPVLERMAELLAELAAAAAS